MKDQESKVQVLFYLSVQTPLGTFYGKRDETSEEALKRLSDAILNQELCILRLETSEDEVLFFGESIVKNSVISICRVNESKPF